jgi:hypothetical protein
MIGVTRGLKQMAIKRRKLVIKKNNAETINKWEQTDKNWNGDNENWEDLF